MSKRNDLNYEPYMQELIEGVFRPALAEIGQALADRLPKHIDHDFAFTSGGAKEGFGVEVWHADASSHKVTKMIIRCDTADVETITGLAAHGVVHIVAGPDVKHGKAFRDVALPLGLTGPMSKSMPGPRLRRRLNDFLAAMPPFPRGALNFRQFKPSGEERRSEGPAVSDRPDPQKGRMLKTACLPCDYVMRAAASTLRRAVPDCPLCHKRMWHEELPEEPVQKQERPTPVILPELLQVTYEPGEDPKAEALPIDAPVKLLPGPEGSAEEQGDGA